MEEYGVAAQRAAVAKYQRGEPLTPEEVEARKQYFAEQRKRRAVVNWDSMEELDAMKAAAKVAGFSTFSGWVVEMVRRGMDASTRSVDEWARLEEQLATAEKRLEQHIDMTHELMAKASKYEAERDEARHELYEATERIRDLVEARRHA